MHIELLPDKLLSIISLEIVGLDIPNTGSKLFST